MRASVPVVLFVALSLAAPSARAGSADDAKRAFSSGAQAYREARYKDAIEGFTLANKLEPHPELVFNIGQAYEKLGDVPDALRSYRDYLRLAPTASDRTTVEASIKNLEARLRERGVQQVSVFSSPVGAQVSLDGTHVGQTPWTGEIAPGRHVLVLRATGFPDTAKEFLLTGDRAMDLDIGLSANGGSVGATTLGTQAPAAPTETNAPSRPLASDAAKVEPPPSGFPLRPLTVVALGAGVVSFGAALGFELARKGSEDAARADNTQTGYASKYDSMSTQQTLARAFLVAGAITSAAGLALVVVDVRKSGSAPARTAGIGCFGTACGPFAKGSF